MTDQDNFEKRAREAAERYATGNHSVSFADTHDVAAFLEGTKWARAEMQGEMQSCEDHAYAHIKMGDEAWAEERARLNRELEQTKSLLVDDFFQRDRDHWYKECERLKGELDALTDAVKNNKITEQYQRGLDDAIEVIDANAAEIKSLKGELEQAKATFKDANGMAAREILQLIEEKERVSLIAESYRATLLLVQKYWFDGREKPGTACWACDMGEAGVKTNPDGHDFDCPVSAARQALEGER